jgi:ABC-2 type transport system permease protein
MFLWGEIVQNPHGALAHTLSLVPITAPATMMLRLGAAEIGTFDILASLGITISGGLLALWGSARVFRAGLLLYGRRMSIRGVLTALRQAG